MGIDNVQNITGKPVTYVYECRECGEERKVTVQPDSERPRFVACHIEDCLGLCYLKGPQ